MPDPFEWDDDDADLDDRYYLNRHYPWCARKPREEALDGVLDSEVGNPVGGPE